MNQLTTKVKGKANPIIRLHVLVNIAFWSGASIMLIELSAIRILAPWFGNTLFTWTGLIGVILCAMSGGYYFGGWLADRKPSFVILGHMLLAASGLTLLVPVLAPSLTDMFSQGDNIILGPVIASMILFALPGFLLGTVSPFAIRLTSMASADKKVGASAGMIGMFSTLGSVIGTFGAGFLLIPNLGIRMIFILVGVLLALLAALTYCLYMPRGRKLAGTLSGTVLLTVTLSLLISFTTPGPAAGVVYDHTNFYHRIRITEEDVPGEGTLRTLMLDTTREGSQFVETGKSAIPFQSYWELSTVFCPGLERAAFLGAGAFMMPEAACDAFPGSTVDVVDIDPEVITVGRAFFRVDEYPQMNAIACDARVFLANSPGQYDLIFGDAYNGIRAIPSHLVTAEFFGLIKDRLNSDGVYMMNIISAYQGERSMLFKSLAKTLSGEFANLHVFAVDPSKPGTIQNLLLVASDRNLEMSVDADTAGDNRQWLEFLLKTRIPPGKCNYADGQVLTDNYNPVDFIIALGLLADD